MSTSSSIDLTTGEGAVERWGVFGPRSQVSKSTTDPGTDPAPSGKPHSAPKDEMTHNSVHMIYLSVCVGLNLSHKKHNLS